MTRQQENRVKNLVDKHQREKTQEYIKELEAYYDEHKDEYSDPVSKEEYIEHCLDLQALEAAYLYHGIYESNVDEDILAAERYVANIEKDKVDNSGTVDTLVGVAVIAITILFFGWLVNYQANHPAKDNFFFSKPPVVSSTPTASSTPTVSSYKKDDSCGHSKLISSYVSNELIHKGESVMVRGRIKRVADPMFKVGQDPLKALVYIECFDCDNTINLHIRESSYINPLLLSVGDEVSKRCYLTNAGKFLGLVLEKKNLN